MDGHSGARRTMFCAALRFWWPVMAKDVARLTRECAHCRLTNATWHESAGLFHDFESDIPLDVVFLNFWSPGDNVTDKDVTKKILTYTCCMTSFAAMAFAGGVVDAESVAMLAMESFFTQLGLPRLMVVDAEGVFAGLFKMLFGSLGIPVEAVSQENHRALRNEIFYKYLNKVQRLHTVDKASL